MGYFIEKLDERFTIEDLRCVVFDIQGGQIALDLFDPSNFISSQLRKEIVLNRSDCIFSW